MSIRGCGVGCTPICVLTSQERGGSQKQDPVKRRPEAARGGPGGAASGEVCPADARTATSSLPDHGKARLGEPLGLWHFVTQPWQTAHTGRAEGGCGRRRCDSHGRGEGMKDAARPGRQGWREALGTEEDEGWTFLQDGPGRRERRRLRFILLIQINSDFEKSSPNFCF